MGRISMPQGKGSQLHNRREYEKIGKPIPDNIDVTKSHENITIVDLDIREAYREIFGEALEQYNGKQKRADRKIEDYYDHIQKSKNGEKLFYEDVVQWGKKEDFQNNPELRQRAKEALREYASTFQERNPNLKLVGAYLHMDEASPHLHIDYVPVAHGYSRGLATRNSLDKAMKEMGFKPEKESRKNNATKLWKEGERAYFGEICCGLGLEVEAERKSTRKSLSVEEYKEARDEMIGEIEQECAEKKDMVKALDSKCGKAEMYLAATKKELLVARRTYSDIKQEISSMEVEKAKKQEDIDKVNIILKEKVPIVQDMVKQYQEIKPELKEMKQEKAELEREHSALLEQINEAKAELANAEEELKTVETAIKIKITDGSGQFGWDGMAERLERTRKDAEKDKKIKELEERLSMFEAFVSHPQVNPIWEKLKHLFQRDKKKKIDRSDRV